MFVYFGFCRQIESILKTTFFFHWHVEHTMFISEMDKDSLISDEILLRCLSAFPRSWPEPHLIWCVLLAKLHRMADFRFSITTHVSDETASSPHLQNAWTYASNNARRKEHFLQRQRTQNNAMNYPGARLSCSLLSYSNTLYHHRVTNRCMFMAFFAVSFVTISQISYFVVCLCGILIRHA